MKTFFTMVLGALSVLGSLNVWAATNALSELIPTDLAVESRYMEYGVANTLLPVTGLDTPAPRLSWVLKNPDGVTLYNQAQTAYQVLVASSPELLEKGQADLWDSGKVESDQSIFVEYAGKPLVSSQKCYWKVRIWDQDGQVSPWSNEVRADGSLAPIGCWVMGVLRPEDWKAKWIATAEKYRPDMDLTCAHWIADGTKNNAEFSKSFQITKPFDYAQVSIAADQKFELFVNGQKAAYSQGMIFNADQIRTFEVTTLLKSGANELRVKVLNGGSNVARVIAKVEISTTSGDSYPKTRTPFLTFGTDKTWSCAGGMAVEGENPNVAKLRCRTETVSPAFLKTFALPKEKKVASAVLHMTGLGYYHAILNDNPMEYEILCPAPTRFDRRVLYRTYDVTQLLNSGTENVLRVFLGHGWYDMRTVATWNFDAAPWRDFPRLLAQLELTYEDGSKETIVTDESWQQTTSPWLYDCIRQGEIVDGRVMPEILGPAEVVPGPAGVLTAQICEPTTTHEVFEPTEIFQPEAGVNVLNFGQNLAGYIVLTPKNTQPGDRIRIRYSERKRSNDTIERANIDCFFLEGSPSYLIGEKGQFQTDWLICGENPIFASTFSYHGFQFAEVVGFRGDEKIEDLEFEARAFVTNTNFPVFGEFESSSGLLNAIQHATRMSYVSNFVNGYPTDCPHREKNGWTGDAGLACELAQYNFENTPSYRKWINDLLDEQQPDGNLPGIVPTGGWGYPWGNGPAWDSALVLIPWTVYVYKGDRRILEDAYDGMKLYVDYLVSRENSNGLVTHGLSDWCPAKTKTDAIVTSSGFFYLDASIVARTAEILGKSEDAQKYQAIALAVRDRYNKVLYHGDGLYDKGSQCAESCPLHQGMAQGLDAENQKLVFDRLVKTVTDADGHLDVGILGMKYLLRALSEGGRTDLALGIMLQETRPCYAAWIHSGGGTLWEDFGDGSSRNHIMYGDVSAWFYQYLAGIRLDGGLAQTVAQESARDSEVAFKHFTIAPHCRLRDISAQGFDPLYFARASVYSPYGDIQSSWSWNDALDVLTLEVVVPCNTTATIVVPIEGAQTVRVLEGPAKPTAPGVFEVGSGKYSFEVR